MNSLPHTAARFAQLASMCLAGTLSPSSAAFGATGLPAAGAGPDASGVELRQRFIGHIPGHSQVVWDVLRNGVFLIGAPTQKAAAVLLAKLRQSNFAFLEQYNTGPAHPFDWVRLVRRQQWAFRDAKIEAPDKNGRAMFGGNIEHYSAAFKYWIWNTEILEELRELVPELPYVDQAYRQVARSEVSA